jgi:hypothetical protein
VTENEVLAADQLPGATKLETLLAQAFIRKFPGRYDDYTFNVRVGAGVDPGPTYPPEIRRMNVLLTQKRIDMLARKAATVGIWELKLRAGLAALGQVLGYRILAAGSLPNAAPAELGIVTRAIDPDLEAVYRSHSIEVVVVDSAAILAAATLPSTS